MVPRIVDKQAKRAEIIGAATEVFSRHGFQGAAVDDIAVAAGVSKGTVYGYFESKEDLFFAAFAAFQAQIAGELEAAIASESTARRRLSTGLTTIAARLLERMEVFPLTLEVWAAASSGPTRERFAAAMQGLYRQFRSITAELISEGKACGEFRKDVNAEAVAAWLVGGMDGLILQAWFERGIDVGAWTEDFLQTILRGISVEETRGEQE
jgi:AcrR family transcriptional regulator